MVRTGSVDLWAMASHMTMRQNITTQKIHETCSKIWDWTNERTRNVITYTIYFQDLYT